MSKFSSYRDVVLKFFGVPLFVGNLFNLFLYGILTVQFYRYYIYFPKDPRLLKTAVYLVYVVETVHTILLLYDLGHIMFGLTENDFLSPILIPVCGAIVAFLTQAMYARRIRALGKLKYASCCILVLILPELIVIIVMTPLLISRPALYIVIPDSIIDLVLAWASISLVIDVIIAIAMVC